MHKNDYYCHNLFQNHINISKYRNKLLIYKTSIKKNFFKLLLNLVVFSYIETELKIANCKMHIYT